MAKETGTARSALSAAAFDYPSEGSGAQFVLRKAGSLQCFLLGRGSAIRRPQEVIQQSLPGGCVVEQIADERCLRGLFNKVPQPHGGGIESLEEKGVHRRIACRELRRMKVPALEKPVRQRMADV